MARKLIKDLALQQAMQLFWTHGYHATSMDMLTKALGVEKPSIYAAFGNKHDLYIAALIHYRTELLKLVRHVLNADTSPRANLDRMLRLMMTSLYNPATPIGCLVTNSALELADHDEDVALQVKLMLDELTQAFAQVIQRGQDAGEITHSASAQLLARFLIQWTEGVRITEKTRPEQHELEALVDFVMSQLAM